jgi:hypothetical protein
MGAKTYDVDLSHSGAENSEKARREQEGRDLRPAPYPGCGSLSALGMEGN